MMNTCAVEFPKTRTIWQHIAQSCCEQDTSRIENLITDAVIAHSNPEMVVGQFFGSCDAGFDDQTAMLGDFITASCQQLCWFDAVMSQKTVNTMRIDVSRTVMMKCQNAS